MPVMTLIGMGPGLSRALAERFGREGFAVAMIARSADKLNSYAAELAQRGVKAYGFPADAADFAALDAAFARIHAEVGLTDVLIYNAAALRRTPILEENTERMVNDFKINVVGAFRAVQLVLPHMQQQRSGTILFTGGGYSQWPSQAYGSVSIGKAGLRSLALSLAEALQGTGIHVNTITIYDTIQEGSGKYSPARIADEFWKVHQQPGQFETEVGY